MSGGSFNYLCHKAGDLSELAQAESDLEDMIRELRQLPGARAAELDTIKVLVILQTARENVEALRKLEPVWRAVEWWRSCDSNRDAAIAACAEYAEKSL